MGGNICRSRSSITTIDQSQEAGALKATLATNNLGELLEDLPCTQGHPRQGLMGVVGTHDGTRPTCGPPRKGAPLEEDDPSSPLAGKLPGDAGTATATTNHDDVGYFATHQFDLLVRGLGLAQL